jgi:hypothetical protein
MADGLTKFLHAQPACVGGAWPWLSPQTILIAMHV